MNGTYQIEWVNIIVSIVIISLGITMMGFRYRFIGMCSCSCGVGCLIYYCFLGIWNGINDWTIYAWAVGFGIITFMICITTPLGDKNGKNKTGA